MRKITFAIACSVLVVSIASTAWAQEAPVSQSFDIQRFKLAPGPENFLTIDGARVGTHMQWSAGIFFLYQHEPLVIFDYEGDELTEKRAAIVANHLSAELMATLSIFEWAQFGLVVPVTLYQKGEGFDPSTAMPGGGLDSAAGLGDMRIHIKVRFLGKPGEEGPGLAFAPYVSIPIGGYGPWGESFSGSGLPSVHARFAFDYNIGGFKVAANLGYLWREEQQLYSTTIEDELTYGAGLSYRVHDNVSLMGEVFGSVALTTRKEDDAKGIFTGNNAGLPLEMDGSVVIHMKGFNIYVGGGGGIIPAIGTPMFRAFAGLQYIPEPKGEGDEPVSKDDRDLDGIPNKQDSCPDEAEDYDEFEDADGCPEDDNDKDGIKDGYDSCPLEPEDEDGFEDEDGCPDLDHDKDGIPEPEDQCPEDPEDIDAWQDEDGCPEDDNDEDGMLDVDDLCPDDPEDVDEFEDDDGCPDPDNDGDGVPDADDKCPNKAEVFNGVKDDDGCPDKGKTLVVVTKEKIEIKQQVNFATDSDEIVGNKSFQILDVVAAILVANPHLKIEVQGHTDNKGGYDHNMDLSQRRAEAVMKYLVEKGVPPENLTAKGYGPDVPIASNKKKKGRAKNRRVEFHIMEE